MKKRDLWVCSLLLSAALSSGGCIILKGGEGGDGGNGKGGNGNGGEGGGGGANTTITNAGGAPSTCDADPEDDACTACVKGSCCAEITACNDDPECEAQYGEYAECFFPAAADEPSGYSTGYCKAVAGADAKGNAAGALIDCYKSQCGAGDDAACGVEEELTWEGFAAPFIEEFCGGCHFDGYEQTGLGPVDANGDPKKVANYSCDTGWLDGWNQSPSDEHPNGGFGNPGWFASMTYTNVIADGPLIWCGVSNELPDECDATKFPTAKRFPPTGNEANGAHCWWMSDGTTCAQPTDVARAKIASWIYDGYVCNEGCDTTCATP